MLTDDEDSQKAGPSGLRKIKTPFDYDDDDDDDDVGSARWDISYTKPTTKTKPPYSTIIQNTGMY